jgi:hypothetical protein
MSSHRLQKLYQTKAGKLSFSLNMPDSLCYTTYTIFSLVIRRISPAGSPQDSVSCGQARRISQGVCDLRRTCPRDLRRILWAADGLRRVLAESHIPRSCGESMTCGCDLQARYALHVTHNSYPAIQRILWAGISNLFESGISVISLCPKDPVDAPPCIQWLCGSPRSLTSKYQHQRPTNNKRSSDSSLPRQRFPQKHH